MKELTNQSARELIRNVRLKQAGTLLESKQISISEVAYAVGFTNVSKFSTGFKDFYGVTPSKFRNGQLKSKIKTEDLNFGKE